MKDASNRLFVVGFVLVAALLVLPSPPVVSPPRPLPPPPSPLDDDRSVLLGPLIPNVTGNLEIPEVSAAAPMSKARVYTDVNVHRPKEYWDYESLTVQWG